MSITQGTPPAVQGYEPSNATEQTSPIINPNKIAGHDAAGVVRTILTDSAGRLSGNNADASPALGFAQRISGIGTDGTGNSYDIGANAEHQGLVNTEGQKKTYTVAGFVTPVATANDILNLAWVSGTVKLLEVQLVFGATAAGLKATGAALVKRSTANSGGSSTTPTPVPHLSTDGAANSVVSVYTGNPTRGTSIGAIRASKIGISATDGTTIIIWRFTDKNDKAPTLVSANQSLSVDLGGDALLTGEVIAYSITWSEE